MLDPMRGQIYGQETMPDYSDDNYEPEIDWSEFEANYELTGCDDDDDPDCDLRNW